MKKFIKYLFALILVFTIFTGCTDKENNGTDENNGGNQVKGLSWPSDITYVDNIPYDGVGQIVYMEEKTLGEEYAIYINGATLSSANDYLKKLYDKGYTKMHMFREAGEYLEQPKSGSSYKLGFDSADEKIGVVVIIHDGSPKKNGNQYNLVITFANMDY